MYLKCVCLTVGPIEGISEKRERERERERRVRKISYSVSVCSTRKRVEIKSLKVHSLLCTTFDVSKSVTIVLLFTLKIYFSFLFQLQLASCALLPSYLPTFHDANPF